MPVRILIVVDFPAPFGPINPSSSPASIWNVRRRTASTELYSGLNSARIEPLIPAALRFVWKVFWRFLTSMAGILFPINDGQGYCSPTGKISEVLLLRSHQAREIPNAMTQIFVYFS